MCRTLHHTVHVDSTCTFPAVMGVVQMLYGLVLAQ